MHRSNRSAPQHYIVAARNGKLLASIPLGPHRIVRSGARRPGARTRGDHRDGRGASKTRVGRPIGSLRQSRATEACGLRTSRDARRVRCAHGPCSDSSVADRRFTGTRPGRSPSLLGTRWRDGRSGRAGRCLRLTKVAARANGPHRHGRDATAPERCAPFGRTRIAPATRRTHRVGHRDIDASQKGSEKVRIRRRLGGQNRPPTNRHSSAAPPPAPC